MKVALVNQPWNYCPPIRGGSIAIWHYEVARRLARSSDVVVYARSGLQERVQWDEGVLYRRKSITLDRQVRKRLKQLTKFLDLDSRLFSHSWYYLGYVLQVANDLRTQGCDVVHLQNHSQFVPTIRALNPDVKIVLDMRCEWLTQLDRAMIQRRLQKTDLVIGVSEYITQKIRERFPEFANRCKTVPTGIDVHHFTPRESPFSPQRQQIKRLLFVGRLSPEKGLHILMDAFAKVVEHYPNVRLEVVGPPSTAPRDFIVGLSDDSLVSQLTSFYGEESYPDHLRNQVDSLGIGDHVSFTGFVAHVQLPDHYRDADILINPSFSESFGRSLIEAMACGLPVVATQVGGMVGIVEEGRTGLLVEPGSATALAEAIHRLLIDEDLMAEMGATARRRATDLYSWDGVVDRLRSLYSGLDQVYD